MAVLAACCALLGGCATLSGADDEGPPERRATDQATDAVHSAKQQARFGLIEAYRRRGMIAAAESLRASFAGDPRFEDALLQLRIEALLDGPKTIEAFEQLSRIRESHPDRISDEAYVRFLGGFIEQMNSSPQRLEAMHQLVRMQPDHPAVQKGAVLEEKLSAVRRHLLSRQPDKARALLDTVLEDIETNNRAVPDDLAQAVRRLDLELVAQRGSDDELLAELNEYVMKEPTQSKYNMALRLITHHKRGTAGRAWLEDAVPNLVEAGLDPGVLYFSRARFVASHGGDGRAVLEDLERALTKAKRPAKYLQAYSILEQTGTPELGDAFLERAIAGSPHMSTAEAVFRAYAKRGLQEEAVNTANQYAELVQTAAVHARIASWMSDVGWPSRSVEWTREALKLDPDRWLTAVQLYRRASELGHSTYADEAARRLEKLAGKDPSRLRSLASEFEKQGDLERAVEVLWRAFDHDLFATHGGRIASLEARLGRPEKAVEAYRRSLERDYVSATQWQLAGHQLERLVGIQRALPFFERAASKGGSTHLAEHVSALQRAGDFDKMRQLISDFLVKNAGAPTSIEILASRLPLDRLPASTRHRILESYAKAGGRHERLARKVLYMYAVDNRWNAALDYIERRYLGRTHELPLRPRRRGLGYYQDAGLDVRILEGVLGALEQRLGEPDGISTDKLHLAAALHTTYVQTLFNARNGTHHTSLKAAARSKRAARTYFAELAKRAQRRHQLDRNLLQALTYAGYYDLAEQYLLEARDKADAETFWQQYKRILDGAGRYRAAEHAARRVYELLEPRKRASYALATAATAANVGQLDTAEFFYRAAMRSSALSGTSRHRQNRVTQQARERLGHILLQQGRDREFLSLSDDYFERYTVDGRPAVSPRDARDLALLWQYGHYAEYLERARRLSALDSRNPQWTLRLARAYVKLGRFDEAMELLPKLSEHASAIDELAKDLASENQPDLALEVIDAYESTVDPTPRRLLMLRTHLLLRQGRIDQAAKTLTRVDEPKQILVNAGIAGLDGWGELRTTIEHIGVRDELREELEQTDSSMADSLIKALKLDQDGDLAAARDLSDFSITKLAPSGAVTTNEMWKALQYGLDWPVAAYVVTMPNLTASRARGGGRTPYTAIRDAVVRQGLLPELADRLNAAAPQPAPNVSLARIRFNLLDRRYDKLRSLLQSGTPRRNAWMAAVLVGDVDLGRTLQTSSHLRPQHPPSVLEAFSDFQLVAAITGRPTREWILELDDTGTDAVADASQAFQTAARISQGDTTQVMDEARHALTHGRMTDDDGMRLRPARRGLTALSVAAIMGYLPESQAILASTDVEFSTVDLTRKRLVLGEPGGLEDVANVLPYEVVADYVETLALSGDIASARALLRTGKSTGSTGPRTLLVRPSLQLALEDGEHRKVERVMDAMVVGVAARTTGVLTARQLALQSGDFEALATLEKVAGMAGAHNDWERSKLLVSSLDRVDLLERLDRRLDRVGNPYAVRHRTVERREMRTPIGALEHHRRKLLAEIEAYPADPLPELSLLVLELINAPAERGRPMLRRYVTRHAGSPTRVRHLVDALVEHELFAEVARFVTPEVDIETLPVLTNRMLYSAAIRTGRADQARTLAALLVERLPNPAYVASMLANDAVKFGQLELADHILAQTAGTQELPYGRLARGRIDLLGDAPDRGADAIHALLDANDIAPIDHCPLLADAMHTEKTALQQRLLKRYALLPAYTSTRVADEIMGRISECFVDAGLARRGLELLATVYPQLTGTSALAINPAVSIHLSRLNRHAGKFEAAARYAERARLTEQLLANGVSDSDSWREQAHAALAAGEAGLAARLARRAIESQSEADIAEGLVVSADIAQSRGDSDRAELYLRYAYALHPSVFSRNRIRIRLMQLPGEM